MNGSAVIDAVIRAAAIDRVIEMPESDACIIVWRANAAEQIEAALAEAGYEVVKKEIKL
jgi:transcriptional/translational regulatory protein YebC/TACO1